MNQKNIDGFLSEVKKLAPTYAYFNILCPLPKTEYYNMLLEDETLKEDFWAEFVKNPVRDFEIPLPRTKALQNELEEKVKEWTRGYYFRPSFILSETMRSFSSPRTFSFKVKGALKLLFKTKKQI